jgi:GGDEF domain-containing protein
LADYFAVCYADLDHFKEFNDRYSYNEGTGNRILAAAHDVERERVAKTDLHRAYWRR